MGGTALSTWLLLLFSTQLKGECSLIWTRGEEKRSGTGICQEGAGKQRERRRGESGQAHLPREVFAARQERTEPGWNKALLFLASGGPARGPPRPAELARIRGRVFGTGFPGALLAGEWKELWRCWGVRVEMPGETEGQHAGAWVVGGGCWQVGRGEDRNELGEFRIGEQEGGGSRAGARGTVWGWGCVSGSGAEPGVPQLAGALALP